ncbi:MAG: UDP-2,3-diacylglucosamine diphosphatase [Xanthomonadaceae bacterium]|nr:UDP-2,3-diacylglucosamine diphosphatase [Xanthomonadaceae bacterium]
MTSRTLFISDLHLGRSQPVITRQFLDFLAGPAHQADALFILGDLFEAWIGDDAIGPLEQSVAQGLRALSAAGTEIHFLTGNRDFLLGQEYCRRAAMRPIQEPFLINLYGVPTVLLHGDTLCTNDIAYQRFRKRVMDRAWQQRMLSRPLWFRRGLAAVLRAASRARNRNLRPAITDVSAGAVEELFRQSGAQRMIHGHTHRPFRHRHDVDGQPRERIVLGDWYDQGSVLTMTSTESELASISRASRPPQPSVRLATSPRIP